MGMLNRWTVGGVLAAGLGLLALGTAYTPIGKVSLVEPSFPAHAEGRMGEDEARVEVTAYLTGWVEAPADFLIDQSDPETPDNLRKALWVPALAYTVTHPEHGTIVLDTGLRAGACDYGLRPIYWVPCRNDAGADLVSQLRAAGIGPGNIRLIVPSHFHGDHISGLAGLLDYSDAAVLMTDASLEEVRSVMRFAGGIPASMLASDMAVERAENLPRIKLHGIEGFDLFGDGSLVLIPTPGHSRGHLSALARGTERDVLFTFDAAHLRANFERLIPSGTVRSRADAITSLGIVRRLADAPSAPRTVFGHEPGQWGCGRQRFRVDLAAPPCP